MKLTKYEQETILNFNEEEKTAEEEKMAKPEVYSDGEKAKAVQKKIEELSAQLDDLNAKWEEAAMALEEFN